MSGKRKFENAAEEEATRIWGAMTRVVALTPESLAETPVHVATLKLDGCRVGLSCKAGVCCRINAVGRLVLETGKREEDFVLDAEQHLGAFWAFDALMVGGRDLRALSLADRLSHLTRLLDRLKSLGGHDLHIKPYRSLRPAETVHRLLADSCSAESYDGIVFCDYTGVYETSPFKFKQHLTVDFCLESSCNRPIGTFSLLTQVAGRLRPFKVHGKICEVFLSCIERATFALSDEVHQEEGCILECAIPRGAQGKWKAVRRRLDRTSPNCMRTVLDTMATNQKGFDEASFLHRCLLPLATKPALDAWLAILRRRVLWEEVPPDATETILEVHGLEHRGYEGSVRFDQARLSLPLEGTVLARSFFSLSDSEVVSFLSILRLWITGGKNRTLHLLMALQTAQSGLSSLDAGYFGTFLESTPATLISMVSHNVGEAYCSLLEKADPPELLQLPLTLACLARGTYILRAASRIATTARTSHDSAHLGALQIP